MTGASQKRIFHDSSVVGTATVKQRYYLCIDLKSFYASVECVERGLDPMKTDLVVADKSRTEKTICLAVSPSLRSKGVKNRCRLFEVPKTPQLIIAQPRMQKYIDYAARIYGIYLQYISKDDIYVYSIDEAFLDVTDYLKLYQKTPREMAVFLMEEVKKKVGVRATAGIGTNLYLSKIALDVTAKHADDFIGELDEKKFQKTLWDHLPLTDFWRIGPGTKKTLEKHRMFTMRDIAKADEQILYDLFGKDAELIIDHAWGREPVTIKDIKEYQSEETSYSSGQVLPRPYNATETALVVREMMRELCLRLTRNSQLVTSITMSIIPDDVNKLASKAGNYATFQSKSPHGTHRFLAPTNSISEGTKGAMELFDSLVDRRQVYRRIYLSCNHLVQSNQPHQLSLFSEPAPVERSQKIEQAMLDIKSRYGKNAIFHGEDLEPAATTRQRNQQIGGHRSGEN